MVIVEGFLNLLLLLIEVLPNIVLTVGTDRVEVVEGREWEKEEEEGVGREGRIETPTEH